jgi:sirohydrochlorin cobaltochelatase
MLPQLEVPRKTLQAILRTCGKRDLPHGALMIECAGFKDACLVLVGHGSTLNADSAAPTHQHIKEIENRQIFGQVLPAFWKEEPFIAGALRGAYLPRVFIVPLFISEGYFTEQVIPRELGLAHPDGTGFTRHHQRPGQSIHYCGPVGTHPSMTRVILSRAADITTQYPDPAHGTPAPSQCSLFIAGHGTGNNENSRKAIEVQVDLIRAKGLYNDVHAIFMEEDPRIEACHHLAETENIVVVPFFIADGLHSFEDIPVLLGAPADVVKQRFIKGEPTWPNPTRMNGRNVWYTRSIGDEGHMPDVILERVIEQAGLANRKSC